MQPSVEAVVFAFNGTLIDTAAVTGRRHPGTPLPGVGGVMAEELRRPPARQVLQLLNLEHLSGRRIIVVTGWGEHLRPRVQDWLGTWEVPADEVLLRRAGDLRPDAFTRQELVAELQQRYNVVHAYEHRANIALAYDRLGIPVTLVGGAASNRRMPVAA